jgi:fatty acid desaturase
VNDRKKQIAILIVMAGIGLAYLVWSGGYAFELCMAPPLAVSVLFFVVFFGLLAWSLTIGKRVKDRESAQF